MGCFHRERLDNTDYTRQADITVARLRTNDAARLSVSPLIVDVVVALLPHSSGNGMNSFFSSLKLECAHRKTVVRNFSQMKWKIKSTKKSRRAAKSTVRVEETRDARNHYHYGIWPFKHIQQLHTEFQKMMNE